MIKTLRDWFSIEGRARRQARNDARHIEEETRAHHAYYAELDRIRTHRQLLARGEDPETTD